MKSDLVSTKYAAKSPFLGSGGRGAALIFSPALLFGVSWWLAVVWGLSIPGAAAQAGLIPLVDSATARNAAGQLSVEALDLSGRGQAGLAELEQAVSLFAKGEIEPSLAYLKAARNCNPELAPAEVMLARMLFATGRVAAGRQMLEQAAVEHPGAADVHLLLGELALAEGRVADAALQYEKAGSLADGSPAAADARWSKALSGLAAVAERRAQWTAAEHLLVECIARDQENADLQRRLARVRFEQQHYEDAVDSISESQCLSGDPETPALIMARWHHGARHRAEAEQWMEKALRYAPESPQTLIAATLWNLEVDRPDVAHRHFQRLAELEPESSEVLRLQGVVATFRKDFEQAEHCYQTLFTESPGDFGASNQLALALIEQPHPGKQRRALQLAELNARQYQMSPEARATLGWVLYRLGRIDDAERLLEPLLGLGQLSPEIAFYIGQLLIARGRIEDARPLLQGALESVGSFSRRQECHQLLESLSSP